MTSDTLLRQEKLREELGKLETAVVIEMHYEKSGELIKDVRKYSLADDLIDDIMALVSKAVEEARIDEVKIKMANLLMDERMLADDAIQLRLRQLTCAHERLTTLDSLPPIYYCEDCGTELLSKGVDRG